MMRICHDTECPRNKTVISTRIDTDTRMPVVVHICGCEGRADSDSCLRCSGVDR